MESYFLHSLFMYFRSLSALAFAADFPPVAPEFHQHMHRVRLRNLGTTDKNHLTKSGTERFREHIVQNAKKYRKSIKCVI